MPCAWQVGRISLLFALHYTTVPYGVPEYVLVIVAYLGTGPVELQWCLQYECAAQTRAPHTHASLRKERFAGQGRPPGAMC